MKLVLGMIMLMVASNTFAVCVAGTPGACKDEAECKAVVGVNGKAVIFSTEKVCTLDAAKDMPPCDLTNQGARSDKPVEVGADGKPIVKGEGK